MQLIKAGHIAEAQQQEGQAIEVTFNEATRKPPEEPGGIRTARDFIRLGLVSAKTYESGIMRRRYHPARRSDDSIAQPPWCRAGAPAQQLFCDTGPASKVLEEMTVGA